MSKIAVWKYDVPYSDDEFTIEMPKRSSIIRFDAQGPREQLKIWAMVSPSYGKISRAFRLAATGEEIEVPPPVTAVVAEGKPGLPGFAESIHVLPVHRGTVILKDGMLVLHLIEFLLQHGMPHLQEHEKYAVRGAHP